AAARTTAREIRWPHYAALRGEQFDAVAPDTIPAVEARRLDDPSPRLGVQLAVIPLIDQQELLRAPEVEGRRDRSHHHARRILQHGCRRALSGQRTGSAHLRRHCTVVQYPFAGGNRPRRDNSVQWSTPPLRSRAAITM